MIEHTRREWLGLGAAAIGSAFLGCVGDSPETLTAGSVTLYQGPACSCCEVYAGYLDDRVETDVETVVTADLQAVKDELGIAPALRSCHTVTMDGYVIEGHVPIDAIRKLKQEAGSVQGIALPGMPAGSPGMGGEKTETWEIYVLDAGDDFEVFTRV